MVHPQRTCSHMELLPLVCLCLLSCSGTTSADPAGRVVVKQDDDVILPCSLDGVNIKSKVFDWKKDGQPTKEVFLYAAGSHYNNGREGQNEQFKGRVSHFEDELEQGNASIKITRARMEDSGDYTCKFPRDPSLKTVHVKLVVDRVLTSCGSF
ncbi:CD276 antigen -like protein [Collichthys lucidus]|uniref:CD276 antigen-like protein n=1 Tax=Collichthys lucidus TaxID=240159 RepID=A0A4U5UCX3_COLLU|nr:CD276 antigen -like protein [Collichthys lucidus]